MSILLAAVLGIAMPICGPEAWDSEYSKPIQAIADVPNSSARALAGQLRWLRSTFESKKDYAEVRRLVAQVKAPIRSQIRIETGSLGATIYKVAWVVESEEGLVLLSNFQGELSTRTLARSRWDKLYESIATGTAWDVPSAADYAMADGTAYFASICVPEGTGQFVVYAPVLGKTEGIQERLEFGERTRRQASVLRVILEIVQEVPQK